MSYDFSIESLIAESTGRVKRPNVVSTEKLDAYDGYSDGIEIDLCKTFEDLEFLNTYSAINNRNAADKIKMLRKIKANYGVRSNNRHEAAAVSIESFCNRTMLSVEEAAEATDSAPANKPDTGKDAPKDVTKKRPWYKRLWDMIVTGFKKFLGLFKRSKKNFEENVVEAKVNVLVKEASPSEPVIPPEVINSAEFKQAVQEEAKEENTTQTQQEQQVLVKMLPAPETLALPSPSGGNNVIQLPGPTNNSGSSKPLSKATDLHGLPMAGPRKPNFDPSTPGKSTQGGHSSNSKPATDLHGLPMAGPRKPNFDPTTPGKSTQGGHSSNASSTPRNDPLGLPAPSSSGKYLAANGQRGVSATGRSNDIPEINRSLVEQLAMIHNSAKDDADVMEKLFNVRQPKEKSMDLIRVAKGIAETKIGHIAQVSKQCSSFMKSFEAVEKKIDGEISRITNMINKHLDSDNVDTQFMNAYSTIMQMCLKVVTVVLRGCTTIVRQIDTYASAALLARNSRERRSTNADGSKNAHFANRTKLYDMKTLGGRAKELGEDNYKRLLQKIRQAPGGVYDIRQFNPSLGGKILVELEKQLKSI